MKIQSIDSETQTSPDDPINSHVKRHKKLRDLTFNILSKYLISLSNTTLFLSQSLHFMRWLIKSNFQKSIARLGCGSGGDVFIVTPQ